MSDNYVLSGLWLVATIGGIGYGGYVATQASKEAQKVQIQEDVKEKMIEAIRAANRGRFAEAARMLEGLQKQHPTSNSIALNLGIAYSALEMYDDADAQFRAVLERNPKDYDAIAERAVMKALQGDEPAGLELLETIPVGEGQLDKRLVADPVWLQAEDQARVKALKDKHGVPEYGDTAAKRLREMERRRREFEAANPESKPSGAEAAAKPEEAATP